MNSVSNIEGKGRDDLGDINILKTAKSLMNSLNK